VELLGMLGVPGGVRALLVHGSNVVVSGPDAGAIRRGLQALDLLVVCDFVLSETAELADVVLPVTQWAEEEGTMTNLEGRVLRRRRALDPPEGVRSELAILAHLAARLDAPSHWPTDPAEVFDELALASAGGVADYSGLSHALLDEQLAAGIAAHWPYPAGSSGTPRLFLDRFGHADGRARLVPVRPRELTAGREPGELTLITGRLLEHYQSGAQTRRVPELTAAQPEVRAELHPATAARLGIADGDPVRIGNVRGEVLARALLTGGMRLDTVFLPFHFAGRQCANLLTEGAVDPISAMPEFKRTAVRVERAEAVA
jgi:assimilatory nitrate reductase catalytic subunit